MQASKTIYFPDYPSSGASRSGLTISFPREDGDLYALVKPLSSRTVRSIIGFDQYQEVENAATTQAMPVAAFVRELIRGKVKKGTPDTGDKFFRIQSTFRGGRGSPLHEWYPYLEGYSPEFVSNIIETFAPEARDILDPFCGSGTTALVAALRGGCGYYSEVNPVCQHVIEAKALALTLSSKERGRVSDKLREFNTNVPRHLQDHAPDKELRSSYEAMFGSRPFFSEANLDLVLRARTAVDRLTRDDPVTGRFLAVAVLRSLVASSLLIRRGDLRFKTEKELARGVPPLHEPLRESIDLISSDLMDATAAPGRTKFVCDNASSIPERISARVDAIITSPPYLNGTNYFRNTKIELWFMRFLKEKAGLRIFRDQAITSGINDVTRSKLESSRTRATAFSSELLKKTIEDLEGRSYDCRIPFMVENYFNDMSEVLSSLPQVLRPEGVAAIDLGDSVYNGVHVPTNEILSEIMEANGFERTDEVTLRERQSRDGAKLSQTLQVFKVRDSKVLPRRGFEGLKAWESFKTELPHQVGEMARRNWGHSWHSMCSYQGKLKPSLARCLVETLLPEKGGRVLDPFSGVGTIPFEARLCGHEAFGFDISPAAVAISRAKLEVVDEDAVEATLVALEAAIAEAPHVSVDGLERIRFNGPLPSYFHPATLKEIVAAREYFRTNKPDRGSTALVFACMLHILHGNRPYALSRRSHPITPFSPTGLTEYRSLIERLRRKVQRCLDHADSVCGPNGRSYFQDITAPWPQDVNRLNAIITSPPFFDSTRFHTANWMRLWFAGWELEDFAEKPAEFIDERQKRSFSVYESIFEQANDRLIQGGVVVVHVGKSTKCDMAAALQQIGERYLRFVDWFAESVDHCESHGIRDKGTVTHHQYLIFEKD